MRQSFRSDGGVLVCPIILHGAVDFLPPTFASVLGWPAAIVQLEQSARLKCLYNEAGPVGKWHINEAMMCICGWTMDTLIEETMKKEDEHEM